jgi:hypothetical protein
MKFTIVTLKKDRISYLVSDQVLITNEQDVLDLIGELEFQHLVLHDYNFSPVFFDLSSGVLGAVLQKLTNYRVNLAVIGDFSRYPSKVLPRFIQESNRQGNYIFVPTLADVKEAWNLE